jgi:hypothetical protein
MQGKTHPNQAFNCNIFLTQSLQPRLIRLNEQPEPDCILTKEPAEGVGLSKAALWLWSKSFACNPCAPRPTSRTAFESPNYYAQMQA